jgi:hypothetical protein
MVTTLVLAEAAGMGGWDLGLTMNVAVTILAFVLMAPASVARVRSNDSVALVERRRGPLHRRGMGEASGAPHTRRLQWRPPTGQKLLAGGAWPRPAGR